MKKVKMTVSTGMANSKISETVEMADDMSKEDIGGCIRKGKDH